MTALPEPRQLALQTVTNPASAAQVLLGIGLPRQVLWSALMLMAALQAVIFSLSTITMPTEAQLPGLLGSPLRFFALTAIVLAMSVYALYWGGRMIGGQGALEDVMILVVWVQLLRVVLQIITLVLALALPQIAMLLLVVASILGLYIMLHFVDQAHRLNSLGKAFGVLLIAGLALILALSILVAFFGGAGMGIAGSAGTDGYV